MFDEKKSSQNTIMKSQNIKLSCAKNPILIAAQSHMKKITKLKISELPSYHQTYGHGASVHMLQKGFISAYIELHSILHLNEELFNSKIQRYNKDIIIELLNKKTDKLEIIKNCLIDAEINQRKNHWGMKFEIITRAADYFENAMDYWLSEYLYSSCLKIVHKLDYNKEMRTALIYYKMGIHAEHRKDLDTSLIYLEKAQDMAKGRSWSLESLDQPLEQKISMALLNICFTFGQMSEETNPDNAVKYYMKALEVASIASDKTSKAVAHLKLGNLLEKRNETEKCQKHFEILARMSKECKNNIQLCAAYEALARIYHGKGQWERAIEYLYDCLAVAKESQLVNTLISVHNRLAVIYMSLGEFENAFNQTEFAFKLQMSDQYKENSKHEKWTSFTSSDFTRVLYGITRAHTLLPKYNVEVLRTDILKLGPEFARKELDSALSFEEIGESNEDL